MTHLQFSDWRYAHGLSQAALAKLLGKRRITVFNWENGVTPLPADIEMQLIELEAELRASLRYTHLK